MDIMKLDLRAQLAPYAQRIMNAQILQQAQWPVAQERSVPLLYFPLS